MRRALAILLTSAAAIVLAVALAQPSGAATSSGAYCTNSKAFCYPDGKATWTVYGGTSCNWTATITWGDGTQRIFHFDGGQHVLYHQYKRRAVYTVTGVVRGKPRPGQNVQCTGAKNKAFYEYPFTAAQRATLKGVNKLAHRTKKNTRNLKGTYKQVKEQGGAKAPKPLLAKGTQQTRTLLDDLADEARKRSKEWAAEKLQDEFTKKFSGAVGVGEESLKKLWTFLGTLSDMNQFPKSAVKAADSLYKTDSDFRGDMDAFAQLVGCANGVYSNCTAEQKRGMDVEFSVMIRTGAVKQLINDAAEAGKAASTVSFHVP
jgi:hypothetical protein